MKTIVPTRGRAIDHIAFSYRNIDPVFESMKRAGVRIAEPIALRKEYNLRSFFVLALEFPEMSRNREHRHRNALVRKFVPHSL